MEWMTGQVVQSRKGRDTARWYVVLGCAGERLQLADGRKFTRENPKNKNPWHVNPTATVLPCGEIEDDAGIRKALAALAAKAPVQGG